MLYQNTFFRSLEEILGLHATKSRLTPLIEPSLTKCPSSDGSGTISVNVSVLTDPNGFVVELNQLMEELH